MSEIAIALSLVTIVLVGWTYWRLRMTAKAVAYLIASLKNLVDALTEQQNINVAQQQMNEHINTNLEILGVHTKLIKPSIGYEATQFLAWYNKKKEEDNG